jgi:Fe-S-cluster-containing dehydrogenase component/CRP-like cAMP-binding protein
MEIAAANTETTHRLAPHLSVAVIADALGGVPFFGHVPPPRLEELVRSSFLRRKLHGETVIRQGEYGHTLFVLIEGAIDIEVTADNGKIIKLAHLESAGAHFGELAILGRTRRTATITAVGPSVLLEIEKTKIEKVDKEVGKVLELIEQSSQRRAMQNFLGQHRAFSEVGEARLTALINTSSIRVHPRGTTIFSENDPAGHVLIIKSGVAKLVRRENDQLAVLAYFNTGDVVGLSDGKIRTADLVSMGYVEAIYCPKHEFERLRTIRPGFFDQFQKAELKPDDKSSALIDIGDGNTVFRFLDDIVADGAHEAQSLLTIDLNLCIRCGNCVRACEARHGYSKMTRRGKKLVRREEMRTAGVYQTLLLPTSCRHCVNPECMIGCPTGAIHRMPTGEVKIHDFCIGCSSCANRCPWENITMIPTPGRLVNGEEMKQIASKCDLCAGYEDSNCVNNCPTGAILRIEPNEYFDELRMLLGRGAGEAIGGKRTESRKRRDLSSYLIPALACFSVVGMIVVALSGGIPFSTYTKQGFGLGFATLAFILGAIGLAGRRALMRFKHQLGALKTWTKIHVALGTLAFVGVLLHSGFRFGGSVTSALVILLFLEVATGVLGLWFYRWVPKAITRIEGDSQVEEDLLEERRTIRWRRMDLLQDASEHIRRGAAALERSPLFARAIYDASYDGAKARALALERMQGPLSQMQGEEPQKLERLIIDNQRLHEIDAALWLYRARRGGHMMHMGVTAVLVTLVIVHVASVLYF